MARSFRGRSHEGWSVDSVGRPSRLYSSSGAGEKTTRGEENEYSGERDAVRNFLHREKLPTASRKRPFFSDASGLPLDADAPELRTIATPVAATFNRLLKVCCDIDQDKFLRQEKMRKEWPSLLGADLAGKLEFEKFEGGVIYAFARNSVELFEIRQFKLRALEARARKNPAFKGLRQIRLKCR